MAATLRSGGKQRMLQKLNKSIEEGQYYEAHQMIRTLYFRYMSQKQYGDAVEIVHNGACLFLKHKQEGSGNDLARLMLECFQTAKLPVNEGALDKIRTVFDLYEPGSLDRYEFVKLAIMWTSQADSSLKYGHPELHLVCALRFWKEKNYSDSRYHFMFTSDGHGCAAMLVENATTGGYPGEADLFVTQAVLQCSLYMDFYSTGNVCCRTPPTTPFEKPGCLFKATERFLCLQNTLTASVVFFKYTAQHPDFSGIGPPYQKPLLNFVWFLLLVIERKGTVNQFAVLCEKYQPSIERDPIYKEYLDKIGQLFFGLPPKQPKTATMGGILGDIMQSLMGEGIQETSELIEGEDVD